MEAGGGGAKDAASIGTSPQEAAGGGGATDATSIYTAISNGSHQKY